MLEIEIDSYLPKMSIFRYASEAWWSFCIFCRLRL